MDHDTVKEINLSSPVKLIYGVGEKLSDNFSTKGINTVSDLLFFLPRKYQDYSQITSISRLRPGQVTIKATLNNINTIRTRRGLLITQAIASDESGSVKVVWFNQPYRQTAITKGTYYYLSGQFMLSYNQLALINPATEIASNIPLSSARIVPIYSESKYLHSIIIRKTVNRVLVLADSLKDYLPPQLVKELKLLPLNQAVKQIHFPKTQIELQQAKFRFEFNELFPLLLANELNTLERKKQPVIKISFNADLAKKFVSRLPFKLTDDQRRIIWRIYLDMQSDLPMNRLVEGDVGSGKTVVAVMAAVMVMSEGFKVAFMAPTELLARQHAETVNQLLIPLGMDKQMIVLSGSMKPGVKKQIIKQANSISGCLVIGTHSVLTSGINWHDLALIIIDEQHRFGVDQRSMLQKQTGHLPHFLSITATPIPRSLALTLFNDLDLSRLRQLPVGRLPVVSKLIFPSDQNRYFSDITEQLATGRQVYVVCPYINSKDNDDSLSVEYIYDVYSDKFKHYRVGMIHGQMDSKLQAKIMRDFSDHKLDILVSTSIIEVGVDVANASVMAIYGPDHFGLAQLHQLRGRVGRSKHKSYCYLILSNTLDPPDRLRQFVNLTDGFKLSELDLKLRGPGSIYGKLQHGIGSGSMLTLDNKDLIDLVKKGVKLFIDNQYNLDDYQELSLKVKEARQLTYLN